MHVLLYIVILFILVAPEEEPSLEPTIDAPIIPPQKSTTCSEIDFFCPRWKLVYTCDEPFMRKFCKQTCGSCGEPLADPERTNFGFRSPDAKKKLRTMRMFQERKKRKAAGEKAVALTKANVFEEDKAENQTKANETIILSEEELFELRELKKEAKLIVRQKVQRAEKSGDVLVLATALEAEAFVDIYPNFFSNAGTELPRSRIRLENHRDTAYQLYWVDRMGNLVKQNVIKSKIGLEVMNTFATHMFFLKKTESEATEAIIIAPTIYDFVTVLLLPNSKVFTYPRRPENKTANATDIQQRRTQTEEWIYLAESARWGQKQDLEKAHELYHKLLLEGTDKGKGHAITKLGEQFLHKEPADFDTAKSYFKFAAEFGDADALYQLGWISEFIERDLETANVYYQTAAKHHKYHLAGLLLSYRALLKNTSTSCRESANGYKQIAADTFRAIGSLDRTLETVRLSKENARERQLNIPTDELRFWKDRAIHGDANANLRLGQTYLFGLRGVQQNFGMARAHFQDAAVGGRQDVAAFANNFLAHMSWKGMGANQGNTSRAFRLFQKSAARNNSIGMNNLGYMYWNGVSVEKNLTMALHWFMKAANRKHPDSFYYLGVIHSSGQKVGNVKVERNLTKSFDFFMQAADLGHKRSMLEAANMLLSGAGTNRSCEKAIPLYKKVAEHHKVKFGLENAFRAFTREEMSESFILFAQMAEAGYVNGQVNAAWLANREEDVDVISRNFNEVERQELVFHYVNLAAAQNDTESQRNVGDFYYYNRSGISDDFLEKACAYDYMEQAFDFYSKAASGRPKDLQSMYNIAWMAHHGIGTTKNYSIARNMYWKTLNTSIDEALVPVGATLLALEVEVFFKEGHYVLLWLITQYQQELLTIIGFFIFNILTIIFAVRQWELFINRYL